MLPCPPRVALPCSCACPACPRREEGGGCATPGGEGDHPVPDPGPVPDTPDPEQQPLAAPCLQHSTPCSTLLPLLAEGWGGTWTLPSSKPPCSPLLLAIPGRR